VVTDNDLDGSKRTAISLAKEFWNNRERFAVETFPPVEAIRHGLGISGGPVLLVETADCVGGGAAGDSVATLRALIEANPEGISLVPVVDPEAAHACHQAGVGSTVSLALGHKIDKRWGTPLTVTGEVACLTLGDFRYQGGIWQGKEASMGPSAILRIGSIHILISTRPTYDWAGEQFQSMGLQPAEAKFIVVKNPMNYRLAYAEIVRGAYILDTPGPTPATLEHIDYKRLEHPFYPQDRGLCDIVPSLVQ
jgi:microcystin degradation protein MlrC